MTPALGNTVENPIGIRTDSLSLPTALLCILKEPFMWFAGAGILDEESWPHYEVSEDKYLLLKT